ncbi:MAG: hypothetical protein Q9M91_05640 [Candidatus Dojkabacteria bacterium]|nr:hypothetical protein [Candidatus Dojkabacteria bacterium]MDQ7021284.1 hypothetical protein [Candidatus Dojkabacteria bacterium]
MNQNTSQSIGSMMNQNHTHTSPSKNSSNKIKNISLGASALLLAVIAGVLGYLYVDATNEQKDTEEKLQQLETQLKAAGGTSDGQAQVIVDSLKSVIEIGEDEQVNLQPITDSNIEELRAQDPAFYEKAQAGQYLVVLPTSQRVVLYDFNKTKVVNFSSYTIRVELIPEEEIPAEEKPLNIEIRYSSAVTEEAIGQLTDALVQLSPNYNVVSTAKLASDDYNGFSLVLLSQEDKPGMSQNIVAHVGTNRISSDMPEGEAPATAGTDAVIIVGDLGLQPEATTGDLGGDTTAQ